MDLVNDPVNATNTYGYYPVPGGQTTAYGNFHNFCRDSTLPVCNVSYGTKKIPDGETNAIADLSRISNAES